jgi:hypothetical protein
MTEGALMIVAEIKEHRIRSMSDCLKGKVATKFIQ